MHTNGTLYWQVFVKAQALLAANNKVKFERCSQPAMRAYGRGGGEGVGEGAGVGTGEGTGEGTGAVKLQKLYKL